MPELEKKINIIEETAILGYTNSHEGISLKDTLLINHLIIIAKLSISKFRYGDEVDIKLIFEREIALRGNALSY